MFVLSLNVEDTVMDWKKWNKTFDEIRIVIFFSLLVALLFFPATFVVAVFSIIAIKALAYFLPGDEHINKKTWLQAQDERESRRKMLRNLQDPCPYCKFNLKFGKDRCDECGKVFST
jgi:hypothetical protein